MLVLVGIVVNINLCLIVFMLVVVWYSLLYMVRYDLNIFNTFHIYLIYVCFSVIYIYIYHWAILLHFILL